MVFLYTFLFFFSFQEIPSGTVKVRDHYIDKTEVLNIHWLEYLHYQEKELDPNAFRKLLPDTSNKWYTKHEYRFMPIVLISYEQAVAYCQWRSKTVSDRLKRKVVYRLPTPEEWQEVAEAQLKEASKQIEKEIASTQKALSKKGVTHVQVKFKRSQNLVYHLFGNVSEMTTKKGVAMGLDNYDLRELGKNAALLSSTKSFKTTYFAAHPYLGFRCITEVAN